MNPKSQPQKKLTRHHRHLIELSSLLATAGLADAFADIFGRRHDGADALTIIGTALIVCTIGHHLWLRRAHHAPPPATPVPLADPRPVMNGTSGVFWRVRTEIDNTPGRLAVLAGALSAAGANIHALEAYPAADGVIDEFLVEASPDTTAERLIAAVHAVGGRGTRAVPSDVLALLDGPTRALESASRLALRPEAFDEVLAELLDARCVSSTFAEPGAPSSWVDGTQLVVRGADGRTVAVSRPELPFTGTELCRANTLAELVRRLHPEPAEDRN